MIEQNFFDTTTMQSQNPIVLFRTIFLWYTLFRKLKFDQSLNKQPLHRYIISFRLLYCSIIKASIRLLWYVYIVLRVNLLSKFQCTIAFLATYNDKGICCTKAGR